MPEDIDRSNKLETVSDVKELCTVEDDKFNLVLEIHHGGLELWGHIKPKQKGEVLREKNLLAILKEYKVVGDIDHSNLKVFCAKACLGQEQKEVILVRGKAPVKGKDEWVEFFKLPTSDKPRIYTDEKGNVDNYNLHFFDNVQPKDLIGVIRPPAEGTPGLSVTGEVLPAAKGIPFESIPREGNEVRMEKENGICKYYARMSGRVVYENGEISISDYYFVGSDVGFGTGHIDFVGTVEVKGDVTSDFNVRGLKGVTIKGNVGASKIESDGDIEIGGMSGDEVGVILCGGNLTARYINAATVECKGNVSVKNEVVNCIVRCGGIIDVNLGAIVGGDCMALAGIEAKIIGSEQIGAKTIIKCGTCYIAERKKQAIMEKLAPIEKQIEKISKKLDPVIKNPKVMSILPPNDKEIIQELAGIFGKLITLQDKLKAEYNAIDRDAAHRANPIINARKALEKSVEITIGTTKQFIAAPIPRPVTVIRNSRNAQLRFLPLHPLSDKASEIDHNLIKQEDEDAKKQKEKERKEKKNQD